MNRRDFLVGLFSLIPIVSLYKEFDECPYIEGDPNIKYIRSQPQHKEIPQNRNISEIMRSIEQQSNELSRRPKGNYAIVTYDTWVRLNMEEINDVQTPH